MASTYTTGFGIEKIGSGEQDGAWGDTTNHNLDILDRIASYKAVAITTNADTATLTVREASPGSGTENLQDGMYRVVKFTGALDSACTITIAPNTAPAWFIIENATSGSQSLILSQGSGANVTVQNGKNVVIYCDGAGSGAAVVNALSDLQIATLEVTGVSALDGAVTIGGALTGSSTIQGTTITATTAFAPDASDGAALGTTALEFSDLYLADGAVAAFGDDQDVTLTHVADTGLLLNSTRQLQFGDSGTYIHQSADGVLDLVSDTEIEINATTIDINGAVALSGAITGATNITLSGELDAATGDFSGAVDIAGALTLGTDLAVAQGGTGASTFAANGILYGAGTGAIAATAVGTDGHVLTSNGSGVAPTFQATAGDINGLSDALTNSSGATIGLGTGALAADDGSANNNTAVGYQALNDATTGYGNNALGYQAGDKITTGHSNNAVGEHANGGTTTGHSNNAFGGYTLNRATTGYGNNVFGYNAGEVVTSGYGNLLMGHMAGLTLTTGHDNVFLGNTAGRYHTTGQNNVGIGYKAMWGSAAGHTGANNVGIGNEALGAGLTSGADNVAIGTTAQRALTTGTLNVSVGTTAGYTLTTGANNVAIGNQAMYSAATSAQITAVGSGALFYATGDNNTALGHDAGKALTTGTNNMVLGFDAAASAVDVNNEITLGNASVTKLRIPGINFVIKDTTATDNYVLTVDANGEAGWEAAGGATDWEVISSTGSVSAGTYLEITGFNMVRVQAVHTITGTAHSHGINLSTSGSSNSGVSTQNGQYWRMSGANTPVNQTGTHSPSTSSMYLGSNDVSNEAYNLELNLYGLDETNVGIMAQEMALSSNALNRWTGQTASGSSTWFLYFNHALDTTLVVGCK